MANSPCGPWVILCDPAVEGGAPSSAPGYSPACCMLEGFTYHPSPCYPVYPAFSVCPNRCVFAGRGTGQILRTPTTIEIRISPKPSGFCCFLRCLSSQRFFIISLYPFCSSISWVMRGPLLMRFFYSVVLHRLFPLRFLLLGRWKGIHTPDSLACVRSLPA